MQQGAAAAPPLRYDWRVVAEFLCRWHGVADVPLINPFAKHPVCAWEIPRETTLGVQYEVGNVQPNTTVPLTVRNGTGTPLGSAQPKTPFLHPQTQTPMGDTDLERAFIYSITCRHVRSVGVSGALRLNYYHASMAELQDTRDHDRIFEAGGSVAGAFARVQPGEHDLDCVPMREMVFGYQCAAFVRTMALISDANILNGLVTVPYDVCVRAQLPVWREDAAPDPLIVDKLLRSLGLDPASEEGAQQRAEFVAQWREDFREASKSQRRIDHFVAVPINHVLAWAFHSEDFMRQTQLNVEPFGYEGEGGAPVILYYLVANVYMDQLMGTLREYWMHKADCRPLADAGFELVVPPDGASGGSVALRAYFKYMSVPPLSAATLANLAPALSPDFPPSHLWAREEALLENGATFTKRMQ